MSTEIRGQTINKARLASLAGVTLKTVDDWVRRGLPVVAKGGNGRPWEIDSAEALDWIVAFRAGPETAPGPLDLTQERARESKERADRYGLENEVTRRELVPAQDVADLWGAMRAAAVRTFRTLPERFEASGAVPPLTPDQRAATLALVDEALSELAGDGLPGQSRPEESAVDAAAS